MEIIGSPWFQTIAMLATITGFGIALDRIFVTPHIRERIEEYLTVPREHRTWFAGYKEVLGISEAVVFERYFSGKIFGGRFLLSSFLVSTLSFCFAISLQFVFFSEYLPEFTFSTVQIITVFSFFVFNVFMDVVTIAQTRAFIRASVSTEKAFNSLIFFGSDLIVTLNLFILTYASFLLVLVQFFTLPERRVEVSVTSSAWIEAGGEIYSDGLTGVDLRETDIFYRMSLVESSDFVRERFEVLSNGPVAPTEALSILRFFFNGSFDIEDFNGYFSSDIEHILASDLQLALLISRDATLASSDQEAFPDFREDEEGLIPRFVLELELDLIGLRPNIRNIERLYTPAFNTVDALEDNFPYAMFNSTGWVSMEEFIATYSRSQFIGEPLALRLCSEGRGFSFDVIDDTSVDDLPLEALVGDCDEAFVVRRSDWLNNSQTLASFGRGGDIFLPFSAMFITSMLPTFLLYIVAIGIAASTVIHRRVVGRAAKLGDFIVQQPIGFFCFLLCILSIIYRLAF